MDIETPQEEVQRTNDEAHREEEIPLDQPECVTYEEYETHDCHASAEDGCKVCEKWIDRVQTEKDMKYDELKEQEYKRSDFYQGGDKKYNQIVKQEMYDNNREDLKLFKSHEVQHRLLNNLIK